MPPAFALTYGIAKLEDVSAMTGREMLQAMIEGQAAGAADRADARVLARRGRRRPMRIRG